MRILYIVQHFSGPRGSSSVRAYEAAARLVRAGHQVTVLCGTFEKASQSDFEDARAAGVRVVRSPVEYSQRMSSVRRLLAFRRYMAWAIAAGKAQPKPAVVLASSTPLTVGEVGRLVARHHRVPFVFEVRDLWPEVPTALGRLRNPLLRWCANRMTRRVYAAADHVVALSPGIREGILKWGVSPDRVAVIPNCSSNDLFGGQAHRDAFRARMGWTNEFVAIHAGSLGVVNNIDYLADAAAGLQRVGEHRVRIAVVGDGAVRERIAARIRDERLTRITLYPAVSNREMPALLSAADVGLVTVLPIPLLESNSANKFFDCLAAGLPIVLNYGGWQAEALRDNAAGAACASDDPASLAHLLSCWSRNRGFVAQMGTAARKLAENQFDRGALVARLERLLAEVAGRRPDASRVGAEVGQSSAAIS